MIMSENKTYYKVGGGGEGGGGGGGGGVVFFVNKNIKNKERKAQE